MWRKEADKCRCGVSGPFVCCSRRFLVQRLRVCAGRTGKLLAELYSDDRYPDVSESHFVLRPGGAGDRQVRTEFIGRGNYKIVPRQPALTLCACRCSANVSIVPAAFRPSSKRRVTRYGDGQHRAQDVAKDTVLWTILRCPSARSTTRRARCRVIRPWRRSVDLLHSGNQCRGACEQRVFPYCRSAILEAF